MLNDTAIVIINTALAELGLPAVTVGATSYDTTAVQAVAMLNALGDELVRVHDWQFLEKVWGYLGDGVNESYELPADYGRAINQTQWDSSNRRPMQGPDSPQVWSWNQYGMASVGVFYRYRVLNNQVAVFPIPTDGTTFQFYYISRNWVQDGDDPLTFKNKVTKETDIPLFDRRLLITGLKAKLWAQKGFDTTTIQQEFNFMLSAEKGQNQGARVIDLSGGSGHFYLNWENVPDGSVYGV